MNKLKITIKFNVNFLSIILKYTLYLTMPVFWKSCRHYYIPLLQQECRFTIFCKILLSKSVWRRFSIIKLFLKISENSQKTIWNWRLLVEKRLWCRCVLAQPRVYLEPYQTSVTKLLAIVFLQKCSIIDIWQGSKYGSAVSFFNIF